MKPQTMVTATYSIGMSQRGSFSSYILRVLRMFIIVKATGHSAHRIAYRRAPASSFSNSPTGKLRQ